MCESSSGADARSCSTKLGIISNFEMEEGRDKEVKVEIRESAT